MKRKWLLLLILISSINSFSKETYTKEEKQYLKQIEKGDKDSLLKLSDYYFRNRKFEESEKLLLKYEKENNNLGNSRETKEKIISFYRYWRDSIVLSVLKVNIEKTKELEEKIIERYNELIKSGDIKALNDLGEFYIWIKQDEKGNKLLKEAADKEYKPAQETLERQKKDKSFGEQKLQEYENNYKETGDVRDLRMLAYSYVSLKKYDLAEKTYLQLIELEDYQPDYASLAQMYDYKTQNYENAIKYYKLAIEKISNKTQKFDARDYWIRIGDMYFLQGNFIEAEKAYKNSMAFKHATDGKTYERNMLIEIYKSQGRTEEMKKLEKQNKSWWNN